MKCYLCKSENNYILSERVRDSNEISVLKCNNCELVFLNTFKHLNNELYENSKMHETTKFSIKNWLKESKNDDERRVKQFKKFIKDKVILDYGCGAGGFILNAKKIAKKTFGLEL